MPFRFVSCEECGAKFHVRAIKKKKVGYYNEDIVYIDILDCSICRHEMILRIHTPTIDSLYFKVFMLECDLHINHKEPEKCKRTLAELENARNELDNVTNEVSKCLHLKI